MPFVKCSVDGCNQKLQPILKVDPRDRDTWSYQECDRCFRPVCDRHCSEVEGKLFCDRCRREMQPPSPVEELIDLKLRQPPERHA